MKAKNYLLLFALLSLLIVGVSGCYQDPIRAKLSGTWGIEHGEKLTRRVNQDDDLDYEAEDLSQRMLLSFYASGTLQTKTRMGDVIREKKMVRGTLPIMTKRQKR